MVRALSAFPIATMSAPVLAEEAARKRMKRKRRRRKVDDDLAKDQHEMYQRDVLG